MSEIFKASHDLELNYHNFGAFVRGYYFTDFLSDDTRRTPLSDQAKDRVVRGGEVPRHVWPRQIRRSAPTHPVRSPLRPAGAKPRREHVHSEWHQRGPIPSTSSKLRAPGSELKEALLPVDMIKASIGVTKNVTIEPFWLLEFRHNELEPAGTYFSTNDFAARGGSKVFLGFGTFPDNGTLGSNPARPRPRGE